MASSYSMSEEEIKYVLLSTLVLGAALAAYNSVSSVQTAAMWTVTAGLVILTREFGQRTVAEWMDAYVELELSKDGSALTILGAIMAFLTQLPIILVFPVTNSFSGKRYEHWGRSIDAIWMKRQFWMVAGGLVALFTGWLVTYSLGWVMMAEAFILFTFFQLMPFDYKNIPTGCLDGAYVLRWSGAYWLITISIAIIGLVLTL